jgi:uncharacterized membrane protein YqjE
MSSEQPSMSERFTAFLGLVRGLSDVLGSAVGRGVSSVVSCWRQELRRTVAALALSMAAMLFAFAAALFAAFAVMLALWETHRVLAAALIALVFALLALAAALLVRHQTAVDPAGR